MEDNHWSKTISLGELLCSKNKNENEKGSKMTLADLTVHFEIKA